MQFLNKHAQKVQTILLVFAVFAAGFTFGNLASPSEAQSRVAISDTDQAFEAFWEAYQIIQDRYVDAIPIDTLVDGAIRGMVDTLDDPNSGYIAPELYENATNYSGEFEGIGVTIRTIEETGEIEVISVIPNGPAEGVGVQRGDIFWEVDGENIVGITQAELVTIVPGPAGTSVNITFKRGEEFINYDIVRDRFEIPNVEYELLDGNIGYISMQDFNSQSRPQFDEAIEDLNVNSLNGLIFDLRGNPGGTLASAIEIGSAFVEDGVLLRQISRTGPEEVTRTNGDFIGIEVPVVLLIDEFSASASEVIAGALQDASVAMLIGEVTFGKGTVQNIPQLSNGGGLRITIKRWLTPNGQWIHEQGITPDIFVDWDPEDPTDPDLDDPQLQAAIDFLSGADISN